jgi:HPt (histidine-containing phosphotransfer) domain-containing protein
MQNELQKLIAHHCATISRKAGNLADLLAGLRKAPIGSSAKIDQAIALAHEIRGSGGSIGFDEIFVKATQLENALKKLLQTAAVTVPDSAEALYHLDNFMKAAQNLAPEDSRLFNADLAALNS